MSRRLHRCLACPGKTRHRAVCASCRRRGVTVVGHEITVPLDLRIPEVLVEERSLSGRTSVRLVSPANPHAPTVAELTSGVDLTRFLTTTKEIR